MWISDNKVKPEVLKPKVGVEKGVDGHGYMIDIRHSKLLRWYQIVKNKENHFSADKETLVQIK